MTFGGVRVYGSEIGTFGARKPGVQIDRTGVNAMGIYILPLPCSKPGRG